VDVSTLRQRIARDESGFSLVELLVVMLILGLLIAVAIPTFFNQRQKANDSDSKAMAHTAQTALETYALDNDGSYAGADAGGGNGVLDTVERTVDNTVSFIGVPTATDYHLRVTNSVTGHTFDVVRTGGAFAYPCRQPDTGGCPGPADANGDGSWGG
jgi:type IV pilus assembly protein PilA